jgi:UDP-glucose:(heptosyl)LPS alpha-1,3-glucosyltransferase
LLQGVNPFHQIVLGMEDDLFRRRRYRRLVALTKGVQTDLSRFYGVPASDVEVLPNGFSAGEFHTGLRERHRLALRKELGIPDDAWVVLFVANEWERKGLVPLLEAVSGLGDASVHLVAVGKLPGAVLSGRAQKLGLSGRVHFVGPTVGVNRWFGMADAFALPTVYEAWGMVIIEALAAGLPVLTSRCAGASEALKEAFSGFLLEDPTDVAEIRIGLERMRGGVRWTGVEIAASVSEYEWEKVLGRYEEVVRSCV